jgi:hypothetical protein
MGESLRPPRSQPPCAAMQIQHVDAAIREMFNTSHTRMMGEAPRLERLLLAALHLEARYSGRAEAVLHVSGMVRGRGGGGGGGGGD